jgi:hypothetical protein
MMEDIDLTTLSKETLIQIVKDRQTKEKEAQDALRKSSEEQLQLKTRLVEYEKNIDQRLFMVGGIATEKIKDIATIAKICKMDDYYATFLEQRLAKGDPQGADYFLNAINARIQPLIERSKIEIEDAQVDESGEALITTLESLDDKLFKPYSNVGMIDEKFANTYADARAEFYSFKRMLHLWQHYVVEVYNLMLAGQHAYIHAQKARNPDTPLVIEAGDQEENTRVQELSERLEEEIKARKQLEAKLNVVSAQLSEAKATVAKEEDLAIMEEAKEKVVPDDATGDLPPAPEPDERSRRRRRE